MKSLNYGRIQWSYESEFDPHLPCTPKPMLNFSPVQMGGRSKIPDFSDRVSLQLLKLNAPNGRPFKEAYRTWFLHYQWQEKDLGEGRAFYRWIKKSGRPLLFSPRDLSLHPYFTQKNSPQHASDDEFAQEHSFVLPPVMVKERRIKLYLSDEDVLGLIHLPYGVETDFLHLVKAYVEKRFEWEKWRAPAPTFLDWVKSLGARPVFKSGQLGFSSPIFPISQIEKA